MDFDSTLTELEKNSITVTYSPFEGQIPVGISKIGGKPDLPSDFSWFYFEGKNYEGVVKKRPLSFIAQINCKDIKQYDKDGLLPSNGMLYFFYELESMTWGFDPEDKGSARVFYYLGDTAKLLRTELPSDLSESLILPEMKIGFSERPDWPDFDEFIEWHNEVRYDEWVAYDEAKSKYNDDSEDETANKVLGYADLIQSGMLLECEEVTNGIYTGSSTEIPEDELKKYKQQCTQWQLLFQLDSIQTPDYEMLWGDVGRIYFYIRTADLKDLNFDNSWLILQCS